MLLTRPTLPVNYRYTQNDRPQLPRKLRKPSSKFFRNSPDIFAYNLGFNYSSGSARIPNPVCVCRRPRGLNRMHIKEPRGHRSCTLCDDYFVSGLEFEKHHISCLHESLHHVGIGEVNKGFIQIAVQQNNEDAPIPVPSHSHTHPPRRTLPLLPPVSVSENVTRAPNSPEYLQDVEPAVPPHMMQSQDPFSNAAAPRSQSDDARYGSGDDGEISSNTSSSRYEPQSSAIEDAEDWNLYCRRCDRYFSSERDIHRHLRDTHSEAYLSDTCPICSISCVLSDHLHQAALHRKQQDDIPATDAQRTWPQPCYHCHSSFTSAEAFAKHQRDIEVHNNIIQENIRAERNTSEWHFYCWPCDQYFSSNRALKEHLNECRSEMKYMTRIEGEVLTAYWERHNQNHRARSDNSIGHNASGSAGPSSNAVQPRSHQTRMANSNPVSSRPQSEEAQQAGQRARRTRNTNNGIRPVSEWVQTFLSLSPSSAPRPTAASHPAAASHPTTAPPRGVDSPSPTSPRTHNRRATSGSTASPIRARSSDNTLSVNRRSTLPPLPSSAPARDVEENSFNVSSTVPIGPPRDDSPISHEEAPPPYQVVAFKPNDQTLGPASPLRTDGEGSSFMTQGSSSVTSQSGYECPLCLDVQENLSNIPCGHVFCTSCISDLLRNDPRCPLCRSTAVLADMRKVFLRA